MRVRWLVPAVLVAGILGAGGPAAAGGSWLETDEQYYPPGSQATAKGTFGPGAYRGRVSDGPLCRGVRATMARTSRDPGRRSG
jgi:hypothetical protein